MRYRAGVLLVSVLSLGLAVGSTGPLPAVADPVVAPTLAVVGTSSSSATVQLRFGTADAGKAAAVEVSNDGKKWSTTAKPELDAQGAAEVSLTKLHVWGRYYRGTVPSDTAAVTAPVFFTPTPKRVNHKLPVVRIDVKAGKKISSQTHPRDLNLVIDSGDPASPAITVPQSAPTYSSPKPYTDTIKGRGNYSWTFPKKGYKIKLDKKADLLGMGESKHWVLVSNFYDHSMLRNSTATELSRRVFGTTAWIPRYRFVDVVLNGRYDGTYQLSEQVRIADNRVDIKSLDETVDKSSKKITGGYLMEWNSRKESPYFTIPSGAHISLDDPAPDSDDPGEVAYLHSQAYADQRAYIKKYVSDCDKLIDHSHSGTPLSSFAKCIDVDSFANWWLVNEIMKNTNGELFHSSYMDKDRDGVLHMVTPWDFDLAAGDVERAGGARDPKGWFIRDENDAQRQTKQTWINKLFKNRAFKARVKVRYAEVAPSLRKSVIKKTMEAQAAQISASSAANSKVWSPKKHFSNAQKLHGTSWKSEVAWLERWIGTRLDWIDQQLR
ncbi:MAG TPA: CotH kinase family protein [Friedmanniella sp.]